MIITFDGQVLSIRLLDVDHKIFATGEKWPSSYRVKVDQETALPSKFFNSTITVSVFEGNVEFDLCPIAECVPVTVNVSKES